MTMLPKTLFYAILRLALTGLACFTTLTLPRPVLAQTSLSTSCNAQTTFREGTKLIYQNMDSRHPERLEITILERWQNGMTWHYAYYDRNSLDAEGIDTVPSLDLCESVAPWMIPNDDIDRSCDFWFSKTQLRALKSSLKTFFYTDRESTRGFTRLESPRKIQYPLTVDGHEITWSAIQAQTARHETFIILDDDEAPLILTSSEASLQLTEIIHTKK